MTPIGSGSFAGLTSVSYKQRKLVVKFFSRGGESLHLGLAEFNQWTNGNTNMKFNANQSWAENHVITYIWETTELSVISTNVKEY